MAERIQLRRTKGWRKPEGTVVVARPSRWGNPNRVVHRSDTGGWHVQNDRAQAGVGTFPTKEDAARFAVEAYRAHLQLTVGPSGFALAEEARVYLAGHDLACWCPLDQPCHADVLLELANRGDR